MKPIVLDENGHIKVDDSMSDELKEKIAMYNSFDGSASAEEEIPDKQEIIEDTLEDDDEEIDMSEDETGEEVDYSEFDNPSDDALDDSVSDDAPATESNAVSEDDINNLNNLFM